MCEWLSGLSGLSLLCDPWFDSRRGRNFVSFLLLFFVLLLLCFMVWFFYFKKFIPFNSKRYNTLANFRDLHFLDLSSHFVVFSRRLNSAALAQQPKKFFLNKEFHPGNAIVCEFRNSLEPILNLDVLCQNGCSELASMFVLRLIVSVPFSPILAGLFMCVTGSGV